MGSTFTLEAALSALRVHGRIIACGGISGYNEEKPRPGPPNLFNITTKRLTVKGLIGTNHRTDAYGGPARNRARFTLEIAEAVTKVRGAAGQNCPRPRATVCHNIRQMGIERTFERGGVDGGLVIQCHVEGESVSGDFRRESALRSNLDDALNLGIYLASGFSLNEVNN